MDGTDAGPLSNTEGCSQSRVGTKIAPVRQWHDTQSVYGPQMDSERQTRKSHKRILCLDGGGIRGVSTLLILQSIMENIRDLLGLSETPRPCDYFSLIGGTSTGGIIAIMLGPLKMTVAQCLKAYKVMAQRAFQLKNSGLLGWIPQLPAQPGGSFSETSLAEAIKDIVEEYKGDREALFADKDCCKTVILAVTKADVGATPTKFKTYNIGDDFRNCKIWEVARATAAALTFFPSISFGEQEIEFIDAGFGHNNPTEIILSEAQDLFLDEICGCIISIGTGLSGVITIEDNRLSILNALKKMATSSEAVHRNLADRLPEDIYFRFNVTKGLDDVSLSDWTKTSKISAHTVNYLAEVDVRRAVSRCARILTQDYESDSQKSSARFRRRLTFNNTTTLSSDDFRQQYYKDWVAKLQQNLPQQVLLSDPIVLYDALDECFPFFLEWISSAEAFVTIMEQRTRSSLEDRYKIPGSAKIKRGEFILQDIKAKRRFSLRRQAWNFIMRPGRIRHMSITFRETGTVRASCPHCGYENAINNDNLVKCEHCEVTYDRIVELDNEDESNASPNGSDPHLPESVETRKRKRDSSNELDLKQAFRRLTLMTKAPWLVEELPFPFEAPQDSQNDVDMTGSSRSPRESPEVEEFEVPSDDDLMNYDWPPGRDNAKGPINIAIEAPTLKEAILQVPEVLPVPEPVRVNQPISRLPQWPPAPRPRIVLWACHECGDSGMTTHYDLCSNCGHILCRNCERFSPR